MFCLSKKTLQIYDFIAQVFKRFSSNCLCNSTIRQCPILLLCLCRGSCSAAVDQSDSNLEVVVLSPCDECLIKTSDDNQNWTISVDDRKENTVPEHLLPDLPRIAFEDGPTNTLPGEEAFRTFSDLLRTDFLS